MKDITTISQANQEKVLQAMTLLAQVLEDEETESLQTWIDDTKNNWLYHLNISVNKNITKS